MEGVATGDMGIGKDGQPTANFTPRRRAARQQTLFAEGCRGSLTKTLFERFKLRDGVDPQTFGIGIKELWEIDPAKHSQGTIIHTIGWPLDSSTYGGSFLYHLENNQVAVGFVVGLDYENPYLSPFEEFQRFKTASGDPPDLRRRAAHRLWRARDQRGRLPVDPQADLSRRRADRLHRRLPQRAEDQGHPHRDEVGHDRGRGGVRRASAGDAPARRSTAYPERLKQTWLWDELYRRAQHPPGLPLGPVGRPGLFGARHLCCCAARRPGPCTTSPTTDA